MIPAPHVVADAVVAAVNTSPTVNAMRLDAAKASAPDGNWCEVVATPFFGGERRVGLGWIGTQGSWRIDVRAIGSAEESASVLCQRVRDRLEYAVLTTADGGDGIVCFESCDPVAEDAVRTGLFSALMTFTVTL